MKAYVFGATAAAMLAMTMAAFAQSPQRQLPQPGSPPPQSPSPVPRSAAQADRQPETQVTLVGCLQREADYRKANDSGRGGAAATGLGLGNEFVLVNATKTTAGAPSSASAADCSAATGEAYELTGSREPELAKFVGRRVEITGMLKEARTTTAPDGGQKPTGGFDPLKQDLKLFEVNVTSFREVTAQSAAASPAPPAQVAPPSQQAAPPAQPAAPPAEPAAPAAQPAAPAAPPAPAARPAPPAPPEAVPGPRQELPRTASSLPLLGLMGALSLAAGIALRRLE